MEERRLLLALALSLLVLTAYRLLFPPPAPPPGPSPSPEASVPSPIPAASSAGSPPPSPPPQTMAALPKVGDERERRVEVVGPEISVAFTNRGARVVSWQLLRYSGEKAKPEEMVRLSPGGPRPVDVDTGNPDLDSRLREALFQASTESLVLGDGVEGQLRFVYSEGDLRVEKTLGFPGAGYLVSVSVSVQQGGREIGKKVAWGPGVGNPTAAETEVRGYQPPQAVLLDGSGTIERIPADKIQSGRPRTEVRWAGVESAYFTALWIPPGDRGTAEFRAVRADAGGAAEKEPKPLALLDLGTSTGPALLYVGPKDHAALSRLGHDLARVVPVGDWLGPLVVPLMALLRLIHRYVGNYGWAIVVLTVLVNLALSPLRHYSIANGMKMAKLAPELRVIQERYRKIPALDPRRQEMQREMAALYERHGMSMGSQMLVGCLPLLLTMPFLFAIYQVLQISIELRGASFLWISDLSQKDPLFLTPLLMAVSMFVMQRMTPSTMDPAQQRMMLIMPLMFTVMFFWAPAVLNLYWLASNACSIAQQAVTQRILGLPAEAPKKGRQRK